MESFLSFFQELWYVWIFLLMAMESSIFPVPSEAVMIPAWYLASIWKMNIFLVILAWGFGSLFWAIVNYYILWQLIWKPFLLKYWKYFFINHKKYNEAEELFLKNDKLYTFVWRFIPVVRHFISIPAWVFKMNIKWFIWLTFLWATIWCSILALVGYYFWETMIDIIHKYTKEVSIVVVILVIAYFIYFIRKKK